MIRGKIILSIVKKDALEALRDPTTLIVNYVLPIVFWPVLFFITTGTVAVDVVLRTRSSVGLLGESIPGFSEFLEKDSGLKIKALDWDRQKLEVALSELEEKEEKRKTAAIPGPEQEKYLYSLLKANQLSSAIVVRKGSSDEAEYHVALLSITEDLFSNRVNHEVQAKILDFNRDLRKARAKEMGLSVSRLVPVSFVTLSVSSSAGPMVDLLSKFLPIALVYLLCLSTTQLAMNTIVEEREKGTLALLWSAPVQSLEIVIAKFAHVVTGGLITLLLNVFSVGMGLLVLHTITKGLSLTVGAPFQLVIFVLCIAISLGSVSLVAGAIAKNRGQGGGILSLSMLMVFGVALSGGALGLSWATCLIPLYNGLLGVSAALKFGVPPLQVALIVASNVAFAWGLLALSNQLFRMASTGSPIQLSTKDFGISKNDPHFHQSLPGPELAAGLIVFAFAVAVYLLGAVPMPWGLLAMQVGVFGLVPWALARRLRYNIAVSFNLRKTNLRSFVGSLLIGLSWPLVALALISLVSFPEKSQDEMTQVIDKIVAQGGWGLLIAYFGLLPALFEEWFFRGIVLNGFRKALPAFWAVALSTLAFSLIHLNPIQVAAALFSGAVLGAALIRSGSLFTTIVIHFLYNSTVVSVSTGLIAVKRSGAAAHTFSDNPYLTAAVLIGIGLAGTALGFLCLKPEK